MGLERISLSIARAAEWEMVGMVIAWKESSRALKESSNISSDLAYGTVLVRD